MSSAYRKVSVASISAEVIKVTSIGALLFVFTACTASNSLENTAKPGPQMSQTQSPDKDAADKLPAGPTRTLKTVMTSEGVECPAVRGDDGTLYTIPSMPHNFEAGDRLNIITENPIVPMASFCQQGETIDWIRIEQVSASGEILKYWEK